MKRRQFLKAGSLGTAGLLASSWVVQAQEVPPENVDPVQFQTTISRNHGHALNLDALAALQALQKAHVEKEVTLDIQGSSGHPHRVILSFDQIVELLAMGSLSVTSSVDAGHAHDVSIQLLLKSS